MACRRCVRSSVRDASRRRTLGSNASADEFEKPLSLEYMADRLDTDDPIRGYQVRHGKGGWLQGFVIVTTFTIWQEWFKFNTFAPQAEVFGATDLTRLQKRAAVCRKQRARKALGGSARRHGEPLEGRGELEGRQEAPEGGAKSPGSRRVSAGDSA